MFPRLYARAHPDKANQERGIVADITEHRTAPAGTIDQISQPFQNWNGAPAQVKDQVLHLADHSMPTPQSIIESLGRDPVQDWLDRAKSTSKICPDCSEVACIGRLDTEDCENLVGWQDRLTNLWEHPLPFG